MNSNLTSLRIGFRKNFRTRRCLLNIIENWRKKIDKGNYVGLLSMDLSEAFDKIFHILLITKQEAYGFSYWYLKYLKSYLDNRQQKVNINNNFRSWETILEGLRQGSVLGPLLLSIFFNDQKSSLFPVLIWSIMLTITNYSATVKW